MAGVALIPSQKETYRAVRYVPCSVLISLSLYCTVHVEVGSCDRPEKVEVDGMHKRTKQRSRTGPGQFGGDATVDFGSPRSGAPQISMLWDGALAHFVGSPPVCSGYICSFRCSEMSERPSFKKQMY